MNPEQWQQVKKLFQSALDLAPERRFEQEAPAASALNHPNILTIYETGQVGDKHFIATEFIGGETLRRRLARGRLQNKGVRSLLLLAPITRDQTDSRTQRHHSDREDLACYTPDSIATARVTPPLNMANIATHKVWSDIACPCSSMVRAANS